MANAAVFFDRDGTLIEDPGYLSHPDQVKLLDGVAEAIKELNLLGYKTVVVTNQSGVARGIVSEEMLGRVHERLQELLALKGAALDGIYYCPYHPEGVVPKYRRDSDWRKPEPGMLLAAADEMDLDLTQSWMIGDSGRDIEAGRRAGCRTILVRPESTRHEVADDGKPDYVAVNIREAANMIKNSHHSPREDSSSAGMTDETEPVSEHDYKVTALEAEELRIESPQAEASERLDEHAEPDGETPALLGEILEQLKRMQRDETFAEFSIMRLLAGIVQVFVLFCLVLAIWFLMSPNRQVTPILLALGFGTVLQLMALTFYIMQGRR
jgi:D,D-heptose 1,7-bisphosphate phosphatase